MRWLVASVSVRGAGAPRTSTTDGIDPAACDRKCFRPPPIQLPAGQCRSPTLRGRAGTTSKCAVVPYGYGVPSPASLVAATNFPNGAPQVSISHDNTTLRRSIGSATSSNAAVSATLLLASGGVRWQGSRHHCFRQAWAGGLSRLARRSTAIPRLMVSARWRIVLAGQRGIRGSCGTRTLRAPASPPFGFT